MNTIVRPERLTALLRRALPAFVLLLAAVPLARAAYPTPKQAGFHHCALIYDRATRGQADLAHYVSRRKAGQTEWLFDAFLFLIQASDRGIRTELGETQKPDWEYQLNRWFGAGRDLEALDAAISAAGTPPSKRKIMLSIPYIHKGVRDFGDVNGDGRTEDLSTEGGRRTVVRWYLDEARRRFRAAGYRNLELWGFYWMAEGIAGDEEEVVRMTANEVHRDGGRLLWIPYHGAPGFDRWTASGIDVAILQPNYAFNTWQHGGNVGRNRLNLTADRARRLGMGVEIECWDIATNPASRRPFMHYLADGAASRLGYQQAATAYYLGTDHVEQVATSTDPNARRMYIALADYVTGRTVPDPDARLTWKWTAGGSGTRFAEAAVPKPGGIAAVDVFMDEPNGPWRGTIEVSVRRPGEKAWTPAGWAIRSGKDTSAGRWQWMPVPTGYTADRVRVTFRPRLGSAPLKIQRMTLDPNDVKRPKTSISLYRPYTVSPVPASQYGDSGRELTDGVVPETGYASGQTVGWNGSGNETAVMFDLGKEREVSRIDAHVQGGGIAAVNFPSRSLALLSSAGPTPGVSSGFGVPPKGFTWLQGNEPRIERKRAENDLDGVITFETGKPVRTRYVTILFQTQGWLMLSEVEIEADGKNVAPEAAYSFRPRPEPQGPNRYGDDGNRLTDGIVALEFTATRLSGWNGREEPEVVVDLGAAKPVRIVTVYSLKGGQHGIKAPQSVTLELSEDGEAWVPSGVSGRLSPEGAEDGSRLEAAPYRFALGAVTPVRYVRVRVKGSGEWVMLSEITVE